MAWIWLALAFYTGFVLAVFLIGLNRAATTGSDPNRLMISNPPHTDTTTSID